MKTLVINAGSSSLKFTLFSMKKEEVIASGQVERVGSEEPNLIYKAKGKKIEKMPAGVRNHTAALNSICKELLDDKTGVIKDLSEIEVVGHRVVHGGEKVSAPVVIDDNIKEVIKECFSLAPLHNPANMEGIEAAENLFPGTPNVAVFDTAFHQSMPKEAFMYAIPYELYEKLNIRRYGFHGTSHKFVANATAKLLGQKYSDLKLITCHLGNGCSMAAIDKGVVADTTMGLTPLEGLMMGTRSGDIDPAIIFHLCNNGYDINDVDKILNKQSGLLGISGCSDMRDLIKMKDSGNEKAELAFKMFTRRIAKYIGSYIAVLGGCDAIIFTGGIGEMSLPTRAEIFRLLDGMGVKVDSKKNDDTFAEVGLISKEESICKVVIMPTNEELQIAQEAMEALNKK